MFRSLLLASVACLASPALAADARAPAPAAGRRRRSRAAARRDIHAPRGATRSSSPASARSRGDILSGTSVVSGEELTRDLRPTIGETLAHQPGVSATSFGPNASRPVLRGFQGERVRVLTDGIGSLDASSTSVDHAVAINPLTADRIEVLRGPSALLFGSSAIGGVVNVIDARIPRRVPDEAGPCRRHPHLRLGGQRALGQRRGRRSGRRQFRRPCRRQLQQDRRSRDRRLRADAGAARRRPRRAPIPTSGRSPTCAAACPTAPAAPGTSPPAPPGSTATTMSASRSTATTASTACRSAIRSTRRSRPRRPRIDIAQTRVDGRAEIDTGDGFVDSVRLRGGYSDYRHFELEEDGAIGTTFFNQGL